MSRTTERKQIDKEDIKSRWEEIFQSKIRLKRNGSKLVGLCPFHSEKTPSFNVFKGGSWNCFGCGRNGGDVIQFIMELEGKTFVEALKNIQGDFNIIEKVVIERAPIIREPILYEFDDTPFTKEHHTYWNRYFLSEDFVTNTGDIYAIKRWAINKKIQKIGECELVFGYVYKDEKGRDTGLRKILRMGGCVEKQDKWRTNVPNNKLWYLYQYRNKPVEKLFVTKSNKDRLVNVMAGLDSINTQSENDRVLSTNIPKLLEITPNLVLNFGSDPQGTQASINVSVPFKLPWFNVPKRYLKDGINDNAEYQAEFGPECFKQLLKDKKYL